MNKLFVVMLASLLGCAACSFHHTAAVADANAKEVVLDASAHWLRKNTLVFIKNADATSYRLHVNYVDKSVKPIALNVVQAPAWIAEEYPHLTAFSVLQLNPSVDDIKAVLKGELSLEQYDAKGKLLSASAIQTASVIDDVYTAGAQDANEISDFGATILKDAVQFKVWAPTAKSVNVLLFDANRKPLPVAKLVMQEDHNSGAWVIQGAANLAYAYYQFEVTVYHPSIKKIETVTVTDPYSQSLSSDSFYSQVVDLNDTKTQPAGWTSQANPRVAAPEDNILYELHIRDFSANDNSIKNANARGKYAAFSERDSDGIKHLQELHAAGLNAIHLLPTFDFATVNPDNEKTISIDDSLDKVCRIDVKNPVCALTANKSQTLRAVLSNLNPRTGDAQAIMESLRKQDNYNWGYDPFHYTVPQSSYAINPEGTARLVEFREMVEQIHNMGFKVIMDVVFNHAYSSGPNEKSVLDKIVPNYYHRLNATTGAIEHSTCCDNTATEHVMMAKLMADSLVVWARDYHINGFRFDLMGHQTKAAMLAAREAVRRIDPDTYFYGEGWNFGEIASNKRFVQSSQLNLGGTEVGTYNDRLHDAIRGGSSLDGGKWMRIGQGIGNGLFVVPNDVQPADKNKAQYLNSIDRVQVGLAANLADFPIENTAGQHVKGYDIDYRGAPTGYAKDPADVINYVSTHDNHTLWDCNQLRIDYAMSSENRVRLQALSMSYPLLAQGVPFIDMGSEFLRSKSFLHDSFDYGDWFNAVDFTKHSNNYDVGLPPAAKDKDNWPFIMDVLQKSEGRDHVTPQQIARNNNMVLEFIKIRSSSPLFRLRTGEEVIKRVSFPNAGAKHQAGLVVMKIDNTDTTGNIDPAIKQIVVVFNNGASQQTFNYAGAVQFALHPVQAKGVDAVVKNSKASAKGFTVPGFTTAVFVR